MVVSGPVQAMEIRQFDKMATQDQGAYVGPLDQSAEKVLNSDDKGPFHQFRQKAHDHPKR
jgi:hypothetical protein